MDPVVGKEIDGYHIQRVLGRGGMGIVYEAEDVALSRTVALKIIDPKLARDEAFLRRFRSEARALARIDSPNIVRVHALRKTEHGLFIVMEYVDGGTLKDRMNEGHLSWKQALPIIEQMLTALEHAHSVGVVHRDIKPSNIMLTQANKVKVTDFGLAKVYKGDPESTVTQGVAGTLYYMSPEQVKGLAQVDHRSDLYSMGMTIYEMLAGQVPFDKEQSEFAIMRSIVEDEVPSLGRSVPDLPSPLVEAVMKALAKDPERRYQSAQEMREAVAALREQAPDAKTTVETKQAVQPASTSWPRYGFIGLVALIVVAAVVGFFFFWETPPVPSTLTVVTQPDDAAVYVEDRFLGRTPLSDLELGGGEVALRVEKDGYVAIDTTLALASGQPMTVRMQLAAEETTPALAAVRITSEPNEAQVQINGDIVGNTPYHGDVTPGQVSVRVEKAGYQPWRQTMQLQAGDERTVTAQLEREQAPPSATATLVLQATPSGTVAVGAQTAQGSGTFTVESGRQTVVFEHPTYGRRDTTITLQPNQTEELTCYFESSINVNTDGAWGSIWLDGEQTGEITPHDLPLGPGEHQVGVRISRTDDYEIVGGTYRVEASNNASRQQTFSGATWTVNVRPTFQEERHFLMFRVGEN